MASEEDFYSYAGSYADPSGPSGSSVSQSRVLPYDESRVLLPYSRTFAWKFRLRLIECDQWLNYSGSILPDTYYTCTVASTPGVSMACILLLGDGVYDWDPSPNGTESFLSCSGSNSYKFLNARLPFRILQRGDQYEILQNGSTSRVESKGLHLYFADLSYRVRWSPL
jgi:hypothetical protein